MTVLLPDGLYMVRHRSVPLLDESVVRYRDGLLPPTPPLPGRRRQTDDDAEGLTWELALDVSTWPVVKGDLVIAWDGAEYAVVSATLNSGSTYLTPIAYVAVVGRWLHLPPVANESDSSSVLLPDASGEPYVPLPSAGPPPTPAPGTLAAQVAELQAALTAESGRAVSAEAVLSARLDTTAGIDTYVYTFAGGLTPLIGPARLYVEVPSIFESLRISVGTPSLGLPIVVDVNRNGSTIYTTQAHRPMILAGQYDGGLAVTPDLPRFGGGDYVTVDVDQVGSDPDNPGRDLTVALRLRRLTG